jgi:site-specific recombinase XerD
VKRFTTTTVIGLPAAERVMAAHLATLRDRSYEARCLNRGTIQRFLAYCRDTRVQPAGHLLIGRQQLLHWLTQVCVGVTVAYARQRLSVLAIYSRALARAGVTATDVMAEFRADHGRVGWNKIVLALRADHPDAALAAIRPVAPSRGPLFATIGPYAELRRSLGLKGNDTRNALLDLDRFAQAHGVTSPEGITAALIEQWLKSMDVIPAVRHRKVRYVARFFDYLRTLGVVATNVVPDALSAGRQRSTCVKPFIFTTEQIAAILAAARRLPDSTRFPHRARTCSAMLTLLCALGLRHGEVLRLRLRDVDLARQRLFIDRTKFHKSRYVPFGPKVGRCLEQFLALRRTIITPVGDDDQLVVAQSRGPLSYCTLYKAFDEILHELKITNPAGRAPRVHDLRHTFAVHRLLRWYREGVDVQGQLLSLSVFMGHVNVYSTQVYLSATADLLQAANDRFHRHAGSVINGETLP